MMRLFFILSAIWAHIGIANAQTLDQQMIQAAQGGATTGTIVQLFALISVLAFAPAVLIAATSFTRMIIVFSVLRSGIGLQTTPANLILISLSLFLTFYVMSPTLEKSWSDGVQPMIEKRLPETEAIPRILEPFRTFMTNNVREKDLKLFVELSNARGLAQPDGDVIPFQILVPAFMISEIRKGFEIGFLIVLPFLVIDLVVATVTMAMGMMMLPPTVIALPLKILFFVLIDGWNMLAGSLVRSFN